MPPVLQKSVPYDVLNPRPLPGVQPLREPWLWLDEAYAGQMARRRALLREQRADVHYLEEAARPAALELLDAVLGLLARHFGDRFDVQQSRVICPDGCTVAIEHTDPLGTLGALVQEDFCLLQKRRDEHVLSGAVLCFPASWRLSEKAGRPLGAIHAPVAEYDANIGKRVQRMFDGVRVGQPLWRFNALWYTDPDLHQPRSAQAPQREAPADRRDGFLRSERQCILRLPVSQAVVFTIHSFVVPAADILPAP